MKTFVWKIGGEAGFGIMTTGLAFSKIVSRLGYKIFDYIEYPSLIRGGHNTYEVVVSDDRVGSSPGTIDFLICLNKQTFDLHKDYLSSQAYVIYDKDEFTPETKATLIHVPFKEILTSLKGQQIMKNTIALGASLALLGTDLTILNELLTKQFGRKGVEIVKFNEQFAEMGFSYVVEHYSNKIQPFLTPLKSTSQLVLTGNEAFSLGAVIADCRMYVAYPMTPASSVLTTLAAWQKTSKMIVRHAEDEISVINTALGSSFAGVRSAVGSSGGGFALMVESVSYAGIAEIPLVIFIAQRPGPATGMPTWTEQGDLLFTVFAGHGEFPKIVLAPGDMEEMVALSAEAFNLADIYQTPVIIMSDMFLSESHSNIKESFVADLIKNYQVKRGKTIKEVDSKPYLRYKDSPDGISPRLIPGTKGSFYQANSYEHLEDGHTTESGEERIKQVKKRSLKTKTYLQTDFKPPTVYGDLDGANVVFVSWGSNKGVILDAQRELSAKDIKSAYLHFTHVYPLRREAVIPLLSKKKRYILIENNSEGQFGKLLQAELGISIFEMILRFDGRPISRENIISQVTDSK